MYLSIGTLFLEVFFNVSLPPGVHVRSVRSSRPWQFLTDFNYTFILLQFFRDLKNNMLILCRILIIYFANWRY